MTTVRRHGVAAAGGGEALDLLMKDTVGPCPSCGGELAIGAARRSEFAPYERVLLHAMPFCDYYGNTPPDVIVSAVLIKSP